MRFSITKKMWIGFGAILFLLIAICIISFFTTRDITNKYKSIIEVDMEKINLAAEIQIIQTEAEAALLEYVALDDPNSLTLLEESNQIEEETTNELNKLITDEESINVLSELQHLSTQYFESNNKVIELKEQGRSYEKALQESKEINDQMEAILTKLVAIQEQNVAELKNQIDVYNNISMTSLIVIAIISVLLGLGMATLISNNISKPIKKMTVGLDEVAKGNLTTETIHIKNKDEVGAMAVTFNRMLVDLRSIVLSVRDSSSQLAASAEQLSASSEESLASAQLVATSAEQQLLSSDSQVKLMDSSVDSMRDLNVGMSQIAQSNEAMLLSSNSVHKLVNKGASVVSEVADQMNTISETFNETTEIMKKMEKHSNDIQNITALITEISDQTNLLALNAAIEAARAGEYGKGFAVVAEEVRKLAEQSKKSAEEITAMVNQIQLASGAAVRAITNGGTKVTEGLSKTKDSLKVFDKIEGSVEDVVMKVESVSSAIEEIHAMADSVTESVIKVESLAKEVATLSNDSSAATEQQLAANQEISSSAQSLANLAEKLQQEVSKFRL